MRIVTYAFVGLFVFVHSDIAGGPQLMQEPLSMLRDGEFAVAGYVLFALLLAIGLLMVRMLFRAEQEFDALVFLSITLALAFVALTPSFDGMHIFGSFFVLAGLYGYYLIKLLWAEHPMFFVHLALPMAAAFATRYASYGGWQKLMILAFVLEINTQHFLLSREISAVRESSQRLTGPARRRRLSSGASH